MVVQTRYSFLWHHQAFVVIHHRSDTASFGPDLYTLRRQAEGGAPEFPPFVDVGEHIEDEDGLFPFPTRPTPINSSVSSSVSASPGKKKNERDLAKLLA